MALAETITQAVKEALVLWRTYLETRQEAYNRSRDQRQVKAIQAAEAVFIRVDLDILDELIKKSNLKELDKLELFEMTDAFRKEKRRFFKYNN